MSLILIILLMPNISLAESFEWNYSNSWTNPDEVIPVVIKSDDYLPEMYLNSIINAIYSNEIQTDGLQRYYFGWNNAIESQIKTANQEIPILSLMKEVNSERHVLINLTDDSNQVLDGHTRLYFKDKLINNAEINIYNLEKLNQTQLESLLRHELGHALGLGHTTNPWDLMYPNIKTKQDLISNFDLKQLFKNYKLN